MTAPNLLFYRSTDGLLFVGQINDAGQLVETQQSGATQGWTHIVAVA